VVDQKHARATRAIGSCDHQNSWDHLISIRGCLPKSSKVEVRGSAQVSLKELVISAVHIINDLLVN
jgi:hypothetical protein